MKPAQDDGELSKEERRILRAIQRQGSGAMEGRPTRGGMGGGSAPVSPRPSAPEIRVVPEVLKAVEESPSPRSRRALSCSDGGGAPLPVKPIRAIPRPLSPQLVPDQPSARRPSVRDKGASYELGRIQRRVSESSDEESPMPTPPELSSHSAPAERPSTPLRAFRRAPMAASPQPEVSSHEDLRSPRPFHPTTEPLAAVSNEEARESVKEKEENVPLVPLAPSVLDSDEMKEVADAKPDQWVKRSKAAVPAAVDEPLPSYGTITKHASASVLARKRLQRSLRRTQVQVFSLPDPPPLASPRSAEEPTAAEPIVLSEPALVLADSTPFVALPPLLATSELAPLHSVLSATEALATALTTPERGLQTRADEALRRFGGALVEAASRGLAVEVERYSANVLPPAFFDSKSMDSAMEALVLDRLRRSLDELTGAWHEHNERLAIGVSTGAAELAPSEGLRVEAATTDELLKQLDAVAEDSATVSEVVLSAADLSDARMGELLARLARWPSLRLLNLEANNVEADGVGQLAEAVAHGRVSMRELVLRNNEVGAEGARRLVSGFFLPFSSSSSSSSSLSSSSSSSTIRSLNLDGCMIGVDGAEALGEAMRQGGGRHLHELSLKENDLTNEGVELLLPGLRSLRALRSVNLSCNSVESGGVSLLASMLKQSSCGVEELFLNDNYMGDRGGSQLGLALALNRRLRVLEVRGNGLGMDGVVALCDGLRVNHVLEELDLCLNDPGLDGEIALYGLVRMKPDLELTWKEADVACPYSADDIRKVIALNGGARSVILSLLHTNALMPLIPDDPLIAALRFPDADFCAHFVADVLQQRGPLLEQGVLILLGQLEALFRAHELATDPLTAALVRHIPRLCALLRNCDSVVVHPLESGDERSGGRSEPEVPTASKMRLLELLEKMTTLPHRPFVDAMLAEDLPRLLDGLLFSAGVASSLLGLQLLAYVRRVAVQNSPLWRALLEHTGFLEHLLDVLAADRAVAPNRRSPLCGPLVDWIDRILQHHPHDEDLRESLDSPAVSPRWTRAIELRDAFHEQYLAWDCAPRPERVAIKVISAEEMRKKGDLI